MKSFISMAFMATAAVSVSALASTFTTRTRSFTPSLTPSFTSISTSTSASTSTSVPLSTTALFTHSITNVDAGGRRVRQPQVSSETHPTIRRLSSPATEDGTRSCTSRRSGILHKPLFAATSRHASSVDGCSNINVDFGDDTNARDGLISIGASTMGREQQFLPSISSSMPEHRVLASGARDRTKFYRERPVRADGSYPCKPLEKDNVKIAAMQTDCQDLSTFYSDDAATKGGLNEEERREAAMQKNLQSMLSWAEKACSSSDSDGKPDILLFHEFPLTGGLVGPQWNRQRQLDWSIQITEDSPYVKPLLDLAKKHDVYIIFGAYAKDEDDWSGHVLSLQTVINRQGRIHQTIWKAKNIKRFFETFEITTTTVESVRSRFQELYGMDAEFPVIQTEYGNLAVSTVQMDPLVYAAFAMKGAEIMLRTSTLFSREDVICTAMTNQMYSAMSNIPYPKLPKYGGHSMIVGPDGAVLEELDSDSDEGYVLADIPIREFRRNRKIPQYALSLTRELFAHYKEEIPSDYYADTPAEELPQNGAEMKTFLDRRSRWIEDAESNVPELPAAPQRKRVRLR